MNNIETAIEQLRPRLDVVHLADGPRYLAHQVCKELGLWYKHQVKYIPQDAISYFPKRDTVNRIPHHRVLITEPGLRTFVEIAARKGKLECRL